jgi:hypothetical protein
MNVFALRLLDRAVRTALQVLVGYLITAHTIGGVDWRTAAGATGLAVLVALLQGVAELPSPANPVAAIFGRAIRTFAQTALGTIGAAALFTDVPWAAALSASALAALTSIVSSLIAIPIGPASVKGTPEIVGSAPVHAV